MPQKIGLHILFWITYVLLNGVLTCINFDKFDINAFLAEFWSLPSKVFLTYYVFYIVLPYFFDNKDIPKAITLVILGLLVAVLMYRLILIQYIFPTFLSRPDGELFNVNGIVLSLFDLFVTTSAALAIKLTRMQIRIREHEQELREEKLQSELKFLRAQTNPHFLFNTLNNIYVLAWKKSADTPQAVMMLSKIMRFMLYDCRKPRIAINEEAKVIRDFIELEKLRYTERLKVHYEEHLDEPEMPIAPLLLLPFVENAFKHGAHATAGEAVIDIRMNLRKGSLVFTISNTIEDDTTPNADTDLPKDGGIGLQNVMRQLDLVYENQYKLQVGPSVDKAHYLVQLEIDL